MAEDFNKSLTEQDVMKACDALEGEIASLKVTYEQYFMGMERRPPTAAHASLKKKVNSLKNGFVRNTAAKFRVNSLHTKFLSYERLWQRTIQEMEAGTYRRDVFKAKLHA
jgi:hypothetical protein